MTDTKTDTETGFDPLAALDAAPAKDLPATFGDRSLPELKAMQKAELGKEDKERRVTVLRALDQEITHRTETNLAATLGEESVQRLAKIAHHVAKPETPFDEKKEAEQQTVIEGALDVLTDPEGADPDEPFARAVLAIAPLLAELEAAQAAPEPPAEQRQQLEAVPPMDHGNTEMDKILEGLAKLAFCSGETVEFTIDVEPGDFRVNTLQAAYAKPVVLKRDKRAVRIDRVVALDDAGQPSLTMKMVCPLSGGGGREGRFPAYNIAFFK